MIDIIIPAYNCKETLFKTLSSLECQSDNNFNVIIVDDCSTEDLMSIIKQKQNHLNIKYIRKDKNEGCGMARQTGIDNATSDYITFLDADDILMPYAVEVFNSMIETNDFDIYHSYFYEQANIDNTPMLILHKDGFTWCHGKLYKRSFINKCGIKNSPEVKYADDSYFNSMCTELGSVGVIPIGMYLWMNNSNSITRSQNGLFRETALSDFINAMKLSVEFVSQHKDIAEIQHLKQTIPHIQNGYKNMYNSLSNDEKIKTDKVLKEFYNLINYTE
jgi:glycosyltransferase involved in cell wall biosynthesis